jgi:hypothetical protein
MGLRPLPLEKKMQRNYRKAYDELVKMGVPVYTRSDIKNFQISAENENSSEWLSYYNRLPSWSWGVNPKLEAVLEKNGLHSEWINPGELGVYE